MAARQRLVAANVANADTPGYQTRDVDFRREMVHAMDNPAGSVLTPVGVHHVEGLAVKNDGNNVNLDRELQNLAETGIRYSLAACRGSDAAGKHSGSDVGDLRGQTVGMNCRSNGDRALEPCLPGLPRFIGIVDSGLIA